MKLNVRQGQEGLVGDVNELLQHVGEWEALRQAFEYWWADHYVERGFTPLRIEGGATPLTSIRVRNDRLVTLLSTVGQSHEIEFNFAFGQAIEIHILKAIIDIGAVTAVRQDVVGLVDLDGPALANNTLVTQTLFDARKLLNSAIYNVGDGNDALTSGAAQTMAMDTLQLPEPMLTARNIGDAGISVTSSGGILFSIYHKLVEITRDEQLLLFALGRA